jgi:GNAT superfamily N-acetyltransferase
MNPTISEGYRPGCIGRVAQLHAAYYAKAHGFGVEFEAKVAKELADFCVSYTPGRDGLWLAHGDQIEGSIAIDGSKASSEGAHLRWFITSDPLRGRGMGQQLLRCAVDFCDERGFERIYLWTFAGLGAARYLYEANGFRLEFESEGAQWGKPVLEQRFARIVN